MVEQMQIHVVVVRLGIIALNRVILIQIEGNYVFKTELSVFMHLHQLAINCDGRTPCGQSQHKGLSYSVLSDDLFFDDVCDRD